MLTIKLRGMTKKMTNQIQPGSWNDDEINSAAEEILRNAQVRDITQESDLSCPYSSDDLVRQYEFFRQNIHEPRRVFYPSCGLDLSPIRGFPNSEVVLMDNDKAIANKMRDVNQFKLGDVLAYNPENPFNLVIALNPALSSRDLTRHLSTGGYVLANNWHDNASQLLDDPEFEGIGTIDRNESGIYLARNFDKLEPQQFETYLYVFKRNGGEK